MWDSSDRTFKDSLLSNQSVKDRLYVFERPVGAKSYLKLEVFVHGESCGRCGGLPPGGLHWWCLQGTNGLWGGAFDGPFDLSGVISVGLERVEWGPGMRRKPLCMLRCGGVLAPTGF